MWLNEQTAFYCMQPDRLRLHLNVVCSFHDTHTKKAPPPLFSLNFLQEWSTYMLPFSFKRVYCSNNESLFPLWTHLEIRRSAQGSILREYGKLMFLLWNVKNTTGLSISHHLVVKRTLSNHCATALRDYKQSIFGFTTFCLLQLLYRSIWNLHIGSKEFR